MMKHLMEGIQALEDQELRYARKDHGETFESFASGYLALAEEVQEAQKEWERMVADYHWLLERYRYTGVVNSCTLSQIEQRALLCACELVQVATVARKMMESDKSHGTGEEPLCKELP